MAKSRNNARRKTSVLRKRRKAVTLEHMNTLLRLGERYSKNYDFEASQWFWSKLHQNEIPSTIEEFENKYLLEAENFNYLKDSPQSLN